jgi:hypothetical protein
MYLNSVQIIGFLGKDLERPIIKRVAPAQLAVPFAAGPGP